MATAATIDVLLRANTAAYRASMAEAARTGNQNLASIRKSASETAVSIANLNRAAAAFVGFEGVKAGVQQLVAAQKSFQQIHYGLQGATGSAMAAEKAYGFVSQTAKDLGLNLEDAAKSFTRMTASASANGIAMKDQQALFRELARSATVMHLSSDEVNRANTALSQSFGKGRFQAEELRQQLGEAIPGVLPRFMQAVAKMNEGTALAGKSFDQLLQGGELSVKKYLPAMIEALSQTGAGAEEAAKGLNAELNRLSTAWYELKVNASSGLFSDAAVTSIKLVRENLDGIAGAGTLAMGVIAGRLAGVGAQKAYGGISAPIQERAAIAGHAGEVATLAKARAKEAAEQVNQARESVRLTTAWKAQAASAQGVAQGQLALAAGAHEAAQKTLQHQIGAATLSANLKAQKDAQVAADVAARRLARAQAEYNAAVLSGTKADAAAIAAKGRLIAAQEAAAVTTNNLALARGREAAASAASSFGGMAVSGLKSAGSGLLALAGGPWGAAAITIGAMGMAYADMVRKSEEARKEYVEQIKSLGLLKVGMQDAVDQYKRGSLSVQGLAEEWNASSQAMVKSEERIKALQNAVENYQARIKQAQTSTKEGSGLTIGADYEGLRKAQEELSKFKDEVAPVRRRFLELQETLKGAIDPKLFEALRAAALKADDIEFNKLLARLSDVELAGFKAADAIGKISQAGQDDMWSRQVARLKREQGEYMSWLATEGKKYMDATGKGSFTEAWTVLTPEQKRQFQERAKFIREDVAAEKAWSEQKKESKAATRSALSDAKAQENQYASIVDRIKKQIALDKEQLGLVEDMTPAQRLQVTVLNEMKSTKDKLSDVEKARVKTMLAEAVAQGQVLAAQQAAKKGAQELLKLQMELQEAARSRNASNYADLYSIGHSSEDVEKMRRQAKIQEDAQSRLKSLNDRSAFGQYDMKAYWLQFQEIQKMRDADLAAEQAYQAARASYMGDYANGVTRAFAEMEEAAADFAGQAYSLLTNAFSAGEDAFVEFVKTGKMSFSSLADSIISDLARIAYKQMMAGMLGGITGGNSGSGGGGLLSLFAGKFLDFDIGGYTGPGGRKEPAGIVHKGEGVLNQDDMAALGGEAGFNRLRRQLRRGYDLGGVGGQSPGIVALSKGAGPTAVNISVVNAPAGTSATGTASRNASGGLDIEVILNQFLNAAADNVASGGSIAQAGKGRYGWQEVV